MRDTEAGVWMQQDPLRRALRLAVVDFALFHVQIAEKNFNWYVFNLADVAIVAGVMALLYDSFLGAPAAKAP